MSFHIYTANLKKLLVKARKQHKNQDPDHTPQLLALFQDNELSRRMPACMHAT